VAPPLAGGENVKAVRTLTICVHYSRVSDWADVTLLTENLGETKRLIKRWLWVRYRRGPETEYRDLLEHAVEQLSVLLADAPDDWFRP